MEISFVQDMVNSLNKQFMGAKAVENVDLDKLVDFGPELFNVASYDAVTKAMVDHIGRMIFSSREYQQGFGRTLMHDGWTYGGVLQKVRSKMPEATKTESWDLTDGATYNQDIFKADFVKVRFYDKKVTFRVTRSLPDIQMNSAFSNAQQLAGYMSMIETYIMNKLKRGCEDLARGMINGMIAETLYDQYPDPDNTTPYAAASGPRAVNVLKLYNDATGAGLTYEKAKGLTDPDYIRFITNVIGNYKDYMKDMSVLFNLGGTEKFTPEDRLHVMLLGRFDNAVKSYLMSNTFHNEYVALPNHETVSSWQGSGTNLDIDDLSSINVTVGEHPVSASGIIGVMFDRDAVMICNEVARVRTHPNAAGEFTNYFYNQDASYFVDTDENFVVFFMA